MVSSSDIIQSLSRRRAVHYACFEEILQICYKKIEKAALVSRLPFCVFEVPDFMMGYPVYDINECLMFLIQRLKQGGFNIEYFFPRVLVISWPHSHNNGSSDTASTNANTNKNGSVTYPHKNREIDYQPQTVYQTGAQIRPISDLRPSGRFVLHLN